MRRALTKLAWLALTLACAETPSPVPTPPSASTPAPELPEHLRPIVEDWRQAAVRNIRAALIHDRSGPEWAELLATRAAAQQAIAEASPEDRPWLLVGYLDTFWWAGLESEWADAVLEIPPNHPAWSTTIVGLFRALDESSQPARVRAYIDEVAAVHDTPNIRAGVTRLELEAADRSHDWARAEALYAQLQSLDLADTFTAQEVAESLDPDRPLRADRLTPKFCAPAIAGPHDGFSVCIDELYPHEQRTLLIGWATWCGPCNEQLPKVVELVRGRSLRVITIAYDDDAEHAREHLRELGVGDWTILQFTTAERKLHHERGELGAQPIPFLVLIDEQGVIEEGPPWLDLEELTAAL